MNIKIISKPGCGRITVATSTIEPGTVIFNSKPS
jgi:hypothetical protein